jgi:ribosomal-protein-serine acetyltransferase
MNTIELVDDRLRLRPWQDDDAMALLEAARESVDTVGRWLSWCHVDYSLEDAANWVVHCRSGLAAGDHFAFAIFDRISGELMGAVGLSQHDRLHRSANLGYWIRESRQRQGVGSAAVRLVVKFGFETLGLTRIEIVVLPLNQASRRTAEKSGATFEGIARRRLLIAGGARDAAVYALIPNDLV